jgi:hypothetical protein
MRMARNATKIETSGIALGFQAHLRRRRPCYTVLAVSNTPAAAALGPPRLFARSAREEIGAI